MRAAARNIEVRHSQLLIGSRIATKEDGQTRTRGGYWSPRTNAVAKRSMIV